MFDLVYSILHYESRYRCICMFNIMKTDQQDVNRSETISRPRIGPSAMIDDAEGLANCIENVLVDHGDFID